MNTEQINSKALLELALDLASCLVNQDRFNRLLATVSKTISCDAVAILACQGDTLKPLATIGLSRDTLGRRFIIHEHPRFTEICKHREATRFAADSPLPDPYDGLLLNRKGELPIHACMGIPLYFEDQLIGLLTLDSLTPKVFDNIPKHTLDIVAAIAAATLNTALTLDLLEQQATHSQQVVAELSQAALQRDGGELIGDSQGMRDLRNELDIIAPSNFTVLIMGETGVGKELVARHVHKKSLRARQPLVYVNCAALPENLIESELFGHVKGAFTGAESDRAGKFALAHEGTIFLDEIGELPIAAQSKLLRVLQNNEIQKVGQDQITRVDVRVIAATNRDLKQEVQQGRFRADLYHRLSVYPIKIPALRERFTDITLLAGYFAEQARRKLGLTQVRFSSDLLAQLNQYSWPGNVRELEHVIDRATVKAKNQQNSSQVKLDLSHVDVASEHLSPPSAISTPDKPNPLVNLSTHVATQPLGLKEATESFQRQIIVESLQQNDFNMAAAARELKTDRANLNRLAKRLGIRVKKSF
ncbi:nitric oxide reductase transcriptional regulator NorR [Saccharobesus litoralis]|uniref:Nitric oxide reductase transcriptional regulator NorR n=1 Tax=Saccharobesus litoralis TaxID=2172099 RepID=A0A2S0VPX1_9ALTE|nr:nitric oxide reductase transcriptional regulator NorR [Saccharobesus litoralis]AWB66232.1 nitric oxide reductase transcriptional regulator NorR [Saccharobesus litoralis]